MRATLFIACQHSI